MKKLFWQSIDCFCTGGPGCGTCSESGERVPEESAHFDTAPQPPQTKTVMLLGNLNTGKTTLFNRLCKKRRTVSNSPGTTVSIGEGSFFSAGTAFTLIDAPGIDSILPRSEDEKITLDLLLRTKPDVIAVVADGKNLRKALSLTLLLAEHGIPLVLNINMMDEVYRRGITIDTARLGELLGIPISRTVAPEGVGVSDFRKALSHGGAARTGVMYPPRIESGISLVSKLLKGNGLPERALASAILAGNGDVLNYIATKCGSGLIDEIDAIRSEVQSAFNYPLSVVMSEAQLKAADELLAAVQTVCPPPKTPLAEKIGRWSREPLTGVPIAILVVAVMYLFVGVFGAEILVGVFEEGLFGNWITPLTGRLLEGINSAFVKDAFVGEFGLVSVGLSLAFGVVFPVLVTFFLAYGVLEDSGYLPRLSVLLDRLLKKIGLTGKGVLPLALGFSCITVALLTTRVLETKRERLIATLILVLGVPCAPMLAVALVVLSNLSFWAALTVVGIILTQIIVAAYLASRILPGESSDFILELPPMRLPNLRGLVSKAFWRLYSFGKEALPLFLIATFTLFLLERAGLLPFLEKVGTPVLTGLLGLPPESIEVAIMTLIRKESGGALLLRLSESARFDHVQTVVCLMLLLLLTPCVNSVIVLIKERGVRTTLAIMAGVGGYALLLGAVLNWTCRTFGVTF